MLPLADSALGMTADLASTVTLFDGVRSAGTVRIIVMPYIFHEQKKELTTESRGAAAQAFTAMMCGILLYEYHFSRAVSRGRPCVAPALFTRLDMVLFRRGYAIGAEGHRWTIFLMEKLNTVRPEGTTFVSRP